MSGHYQPTGGPNGRPGAPWTQADRDRILSLYGTMSVATIALVLRRSYARTRDVINAMRDEGILQTAEAKPVRTEAHITAKKVYAERAKGADIHTPPDVALVDMPCITCRKRFMSWCKRANRMCQSCRAGGDF